MKFTFMLFLRRTRYLFEMIGKVITRGSYWGRMYCVDDDKKLIYIAICKAASTSFRSVFLNIPKYNDDKSFKDSVRDSDNYKANLDLDEFKDYYKFSFVRNPFARLVSCYEQKYHWKQNRPFFQFYLMGYLAKDRGFDDFARRVIKIPHFLADRHFCRQYNLLYDKYGVPLFDYLGKFERLNDDYEPVRERFDLPHIPHFRISASSKVDWRDYYSEELARKVYAYYREDIETFGYKNEYEDLLRYLRGKAQSRDAAC